MKEIVGKVSSDSKKLYMVKWKQKDQGVYVSYDGWTKLGMASSEKEALGMAQAWMEKIHT